MVVVVKALWLRELSLLNMLILLKNALFKSQFQKSHYVENEGSFKTPRDIPRPLGKIKAPSRSTKRSQFNRTTQKLSRAFALIDENAVAISEGVADINQIQEKISSIERQIDNLETSQKMLENLEPRLTELSSGLTSVKENLAIMEPIPQTIHQLREAIQTLTKAKKNYDTANWLKRLKHLEISTEEITKNIAQISQKMALLGSKSTLLAFETQVLKKVDAKLEKVYGQVQEMAFDQQSFNSMIKSTQDHISEPIKIEVRNMRKETESVHRELERTMNANREILTRMEKFRTQNTHRRRSMCQTIIDNRKHVSTSNRSSRGKKKLFSKILNLNLPTNRHRSIRSKCSSLM